MKRPKPRKNTRTPPPKRPSGRPPLFKHEHAFTMRLDMADYHRALTIKPPHIPLTTWMRGVILAEIEKLEKAQKREKS